MTQELKLTKGYVALIDDEEYEKRSKHKWTAVKGKRTVYAYRGSKLAGRIPYQKNLYLHREIMDAPDDMLVDHIDGNGLNCQKSNMRLVSSLQNARYNPNGRDNASGYRGVSKHNGIANPWNAEIMVDGKVIRLGRYPTPEQAARAYDKAAKELHGEFATLNFPDD
jgi:hypothetical protein